MNGAAEQRLQVEELLRIDVAAELQTLSVAQLQGPWQAPAELVRHAVQSGASAVEVRVGRRGFSVVYAEAAIPFSLLQHLVAAIDPDHPRDERHSAIVSLEQAGAEPLLWTAGLDAAEIRITSRAGGSAVTFRCCDGSPGLETRHRSPAAMAVEVQVRGMTFDVRRTRSWISYVCRFAPVPVTVNGEPVVAVFPDGLFQMRLRRPLPGYLGITTSGDAPRLWLMRHGVLVTRASIPGYPAFRAAIEMARTVSSSASAAAMREAVAPHLPELINQAIGMLIRLAPRLPELPEVSRHRISCLLLRAAQLRLSQRELMALPLIKVLGAAAGKETSWLSLSQLAALPAAAAGSMLALAPEQKLRRYTLAAGPVAIVSAEERSCLGQVLDLHFETPPRQRRWSPAALGPLARRAVTGWWNRLRGLGHGRVLSPRELSAEEQRFLAGAQQGLVGEGPGERLEVAFCEGEGPVFHGGWRQRRLLLPRRNPVVVRCVRLVAADAAWLYPALLSVLTDTGSVTPQVRARWVRKCLAQASAGG
jgi:hypothetical protein